ncbi:methionyl-tRNA formyltransferase [Salegentibacter sp. F188]|uniref:Methionyl-tRNA formyltransferase n=1 Tax=Autumnicola patrickiae TaxID=3075591 RepID=A0ABU3E3U5_9FLAO|nr:methionyl-tRNA formyltransferase [Salegentibacter sp. F188]MDT0690580.1 methionyl-tRNA formyltransferase [Salegentibacter sp. F188]
MRDLRIVFMGTPEFAVNSLKKIIEAGYNVVGVITAPDRPAGRGRKLQQSDVKKYALEQNLKVLQPTNLKSEDFQQELEELQPNVQVVVAFRMLPKSVWALPEYGTFNLHASLLPQYRGAAPINWSIINGDRTSGVSTFFIDEKIDTGAMILQRELTVGENENVGELHDRLMESGAKLILETLELIKLNKVKTRLQEESDILKPAPKLTKENTRINWEKPVGEIYNLIRGLNPYPAAWAILRNASEELKVKIYDAEKVLEAHQFPTGTIKVNGKQFYVAGQDGFIEIKEMQLPGKRKMSIKDLLNGFSFDSEAKML